MVKPATAAPAWVKRNSGSAVRLPIRVMTVSPATENSFAEVVIRSSSAGLDLPLPMASIGSVRVVGLSICAAEIRWGQGPKGRRGFRPVLWAGFIGADPAPT
nr:hypothetical protein GCM10017745_46420 [Saccharothrix mutabilis subsp. capreolus]